MMMYEKKVYVAVSASFTPEGEVRPLVITWNDGTEYEIDRVVDRAGVFSTCLSPCIRFTVHIRGRVRDLFMEVVPEGPRRRPLFRWFVNVQTMEWYNEPDAQAP